MYESNQERGNYQKIYLCGDMMMISLLPWGIIALIPLALVVCLLPDRVVLAKSGMTQRGVLIFFVVVLISCSISLLPFSLFGLSINIVSLAIWLLAAIYLTTKTDRISRRHLLMTAAVVFSSMFCIMTGVFWRLEELAIDVYWLTPPLAAVLAVLFANNLRSATAGLIFGYVALDFFGSWFVGNEMYGGSIGGVAFVNALVLSLLFLQVFWAIAQLYLHLTNDAKKSLPS